MVSDTLPSESPLGRLMSSTEWLVEQWPTCLRSSSPATSPTCASTGADESFLQATLYGSIFPAVWNFSLRSHARLGTCVTTLHLLRGRKYGQLLGIPDTYIQGCLLPVARLRAARNFHPRPPTHRGVLAVDGRTDHRCSRQSGKR